MSQGTVDANGVTIWYETFGTPEHPTVLLISGLGSQAISWDEEFCLRLVDAGHHVVRFDNRDVGLSQWFDDPPGEYTLDDMADDAAALLDTLDIDAAHVVGVSMGGMIAQLVAIRHPQKVITLTSIMSTTGDPGLDPPDPEVLAKLFVPPGPSREERIAAQADVQRTLAGTRWPIDEERVMRRATAFVDRAYHPYGTMRQAQAIMAAGPRVEALESVSAPTMVIHGTADLLVPYSGGESTAKAVPGARLLAIEGMGHEMPPTTWEDIIPAILEHTASR